jgi:hypothetical protein
MILDWTKRNIALFLIGSNNNYPQYFAIGSGSGTVVSTQTTLISPFDRQSVTSTNGSTSYKIEWIGDWNAVELSGNSLREWGMCLSGTGTTGSMWSRTTIPSLLTFDGTIELRIKENWEVF